MKKYINISGNSQKFQYLLEYDKNNTNIGSTNSGTKWYFDAESSCIRLYKTDVTHYRHINDWYDTEKITKWRNECIPETTKTSKLTVYIPSHSISTYAKGIKYMVTINTWINGIKIDLGSHIFKPTDTYASPKGKIKKGDIEYYECIDFNIIDPFELVYSDNWIDFRRIVCMEPLGINNAASFMNVSLYVVEDYDNRYMMSNEWLGGCTSFDTSNLSNHMSLNLSINDDPLGFRFTVRMNEVYNNLINYLAETYFYSLQTAGNSYNLPFTEENIKFELILKNNDNESVIIGPKMTYYNKNNSLEYGNYSQIMCYNNFKEYIQILKETYNDTIDRSGIELFFSKWDIFEEGWFIVGSMTIYHKDDNYEMLNIISNEIPITQEIFSKFTNGGSEKIININEMITVNNYNIVNKIENKIVKLDRKSDSKSNVIQPVFFRSSPLGSILIHPMITETIAINLDDYKSKVNKFILQVGNYKFEQIGANAYGILFKITANTISSIAASGTYYILNENLELITTGNYTCA